jgi:tRNA A22 N-methylase
MSPGEVDTVVLAGLSDRTILQILDEAQPHWVHLKTIIACPAMVESYLRPGLRERGFRVDDEDLVFEGKRSYDLIVTSLGEPRDVPEPWQRWGPALFENEHPRLLEHLKGRRKTMRRAFSSPDFAGYRGTEGELLPMGLKLSVLDQLIADLEASQTN